MAQAYSFAGTTMTVLVPGTETDGAFTVLHVIKPPGSSTPPHSHDHEFEVPYVLSGALSAETEGRIETRGSGEFIVLPPGRPHRLFNASGTTTREFLLCVPAIFDGFVAAAGTPVEPFAVPQPMTDEDRRRLVEAAPRFGVRLLPSAAPRATVPALPGGPPQRLDGRGARVDVLARFGESDDDLVLMRQEIEAGRDIPLHSHPDPECLFVTTGSLGVYRDGDGWLRLGPSEAVHVAPHRGHAIRNASDRPAHILIVSTVRMARALSSAGASQGAARSASDAKLTLSVAETGGERCEP